MLVRQIGPSLATLIIIAATLVTFGTGSKVDAQAARHPVRIIEITFEPSAHGAFVDLVQKFAQDQEFEIRARQRSPDPKDTFIQMWRQDADMIVIRKRTDQVPGLLYGVAIYANGDQSLPVETIDQLTDDLRASVAAASVTTFKIVK